MNTWRPSRPRASGATSGHSLNSSGIWCDAHLIASDGSGCDRCVRDSTSRIPAATALARHMHARPPTRLVLLSSWESGRTAGIARPPRQGRRLDCRNIAVGPLAERAARNQSAWSQPRFGACATTSISAIDGSRVVPTVRSIAVARAASGRRIRRPRFRRTGPCSCPPS